MRHSQRDQTVRLPSGPALIALSVMASVFLLIATSMAGIRLDGSEYQGASTVVTTSADNKINTTNKRSAASVHWAVITMAQPLMGIGTMTAETSEGDAFKIGVGYEYNVLKTSYDPEACSCPCANDPSCDGAPDIEDVIWVINIAYRGMSLPIAGNCPQEPTDVDCSGETNAIDVVKMIDVVFRTVPQTTVFCDPCG